jgi:uncharacterized membrane protein YciS (DUF1049 family)
MKALQYLQVLLLIAGLAYLVWFHLVNPISVTLPVPFIGGFITIASLALFGSFAFGLLYAALLFGPQLIRRSGNIRRMTRRIKELEAENAKLKPAGTVPVIPDRESALEELRREGSL